MRGCVIREKLFGLQDKVAIRIREYGQDMAFAQVRFDPVDAGEVVPHFAKRNMESFLHGYYHREEHGEAVKQEVGTVKGAGAAKSEKGKGLLGDLRDEASVVTRSSITG